MRYIHASIRKESKALALWHFQEGGRKTWKSSANNTFAFRIDDEAISALNSLLLFYPAMPIKRMNDALKENFEITFNSRKSLVPAYII